MRIWWCLRRRRSFWWTSEAALPVIVLAVSGRALARGGDETFVRGECVFDDGEFPGEARGRECRRA